MTKFKNFDKIESSEYFKSLLFIILNGQTEEDIFKKILSYEISISPEDAIEILNEMYKNWLEKEIKLRAEYNQLTEKELERIVIEKKLEEQPIKSI